MGKADSDGMLYYKWYKIKIFAKRSVGSEIPELFPYWEGRLRRTLSFTALCTNIYTFGGQFYLSSLNRFTFSPNLNLMDVYLGPIIDVLLGRESYHACQAMWPWASIYTHLVGNLTCRLQIILRFLLIWMCWMFIGVLSTLPTSPIPLFTLYLYTFSIDSFIPYV